MSFPRVPCPPFLRAQAPLPKFPTGVKGVFFSGAFTDHVVLQRGAPAAVYGVVVGAKARPAETLSCALRLNLCGAHSFKTLPTGHCRVALSRWQGYFSKEHPVAHGRRKAGLRSAQHDFRRPPLA